MPAAFSETSGALIPDIKSRAGQRTNGFPAGWGRRNFAQPCRFHAGGVILGVLLLGAGLVNFPLAAKTTGNQGFNVTLTATGTRPVPSSAALRDATRILTTKFHAKFKKLTPNNSELFATSMVDKFSTDSTSPVLQYAALNLAIKLAGNAGDPRLGLSAVQAILNEYKANPYHLAAELFTALADSSIQVHPRRSFVILQKLETRALTKNDFANLVALAKAGLDLRRRNSWIKLGRHQKQVLERGELGLKAWMFYEPLSAYLKTHPDDAGANLGAAAFAAAVHNDWTAASRYLVAAKIGQADQMATFAQDHSVSGHLKLATAWWKLSTQGGRKGVALIKLAAGDQYAAAIQTLPKDMPTLLSSLTREQISRLFRKIRTAAGRTDSLPARRLAILFASGLRPAQMLYRQYKTAHKALADGRKSARREFAVGAYTCFIKADWNDGLTHLIASRNGFIARVAAADAGNPTKAKQLMALGQAWLRIAREYPGFMRYNIERHALGCFLAAPQRDISGDQRSAITALQSRFDQGIF